MLLFNSVLLLILLCAKNSLCMLVMKTAEDLDEVRIRILDDAADHQALLGQAEQDLDKVLNPADGEQTYESGFRVRKAAYNRILSISHLFEPSGVVLVDAFRATLSMVIFFAGFYEPGVSIIGAVLSVTSIVLMLFSQFTLYCAGLNACKMSALQAGSIGMNFIQGTLPFAIAVLLLTRAYPVATNVLVSANLALSTIIMLLSCCLSSKYSEGNELIEGALNSVVEYQGFDNINQKCISPFRLRGVLWEAFESGKIIEGFRLMRSLNQSILPAYSRARMLIRVAQLYGSTEEIVEEGLLMAYDDLEPHWDSRLVKDEALSFANKLVARAKLFKVLYLLGLPLDIISHSFAVFDRHESISVEL